MRAYEACCAAPLPLFIRSLLGAKNRGHIRFDDSGEEVRPPPSAAAAASGAGAGETASKREASAAAAAAPPLHLNPSQRHALEDFSGAALEGRSRLMLLQGPPGSGKSTFLVALLRRLHGGSPPGGAFGSGPGGRLRIAAMAPSNTAVLLLLSRLLRALERDDSGSKLWPAIALVGVRKDAAPPRAGSDAWADATAADVFVYTLVERAQERAAELVARAPALDGVLRASQSAAPLRAAWRRAAAREAWLCRTVFARGSGSQVRSSFFWFSNACLLFAH
jgi:hypothetical protein